MPYIPQPGQRLAFSAKVHGAPGMAYEPLIQAALEAQAYAEERRRRAFEEQRKLVQEDEMMKQNEFVRALQTEQQKLAREQEKRRDAETRQEMALRRQQEDRAIEQADQERKDRERLKDIRTNLETKYGPLEEWAYKLKESEDAENKARRAREETQLNELIATAEANRQEEAQRKAAWQEFQATLTPEESSALNALSPQQRGQAIQQIMARKRAEAERETQAKSFEGTPTGKPIAGMIRGGFGPTAQMLNEYMESQQPRTPLTDAEMAAIPEKLRPLLRVRPDLFNGLIPILARGDQKGMSYSAAYSRAIATVQQMSEDDIRREGKSARVLIKEIADELYKGPPLSSLDRARGAAEAEGLIERITPAVQDAYKRVLGIEISPDTAMDPDVTRLLGNIEMEVAPLFEAAAAAHTAGEKKRFKAMARQFAEKLEATRMAFFQGTGPTQLDEWGKQRPTGPAMHAVIRDRMVKQQMTIFKDGGMEKPDAEREARAIASRQLAAMSGTLNEMQRVARILNSDWKQAQSWLDKERHDFDANRVLAAGLMGQLEGFGAAMFLPEHARVTPKTHAEKTAYYLGYAAGFAPWLMFGGVAGASIKSLLVRVFGKQVGELVLKRMAAKAATEVAPKAAAVAKTGVQKAVGWVAGRAPKAAAMGVAAGLGTIPQYGVRSLVGEITGEEKLEDVSSELFGAMGENALSFGLAKFFLPPTAKGMVVLTGGAVATDVGSQLLMGETFGELTGTPELTETAARIWLLWGAGRWAGRRKPISQKRPVDQQTILKHIPARYHREVVEAMNQDNPNQWRSLLMRVPEAERKRILDAFRKGLNLNAPTP